MISAFITNPSWWNSKIDCTVSNFCHLNCSVETGRNKKQMNQVIRICWVMEGFLFQIFRLPQYLFATYDLALSWWNRKPVKFSKVGCFSLQLLFLRIEEAQNELSYWNLSKRKTIPSLCVNLLYSRVLHIHNSDLRRCMSSVFILCVNSIVKLLPFLG